MDAIAGVEVIQGDFTEEEVLQQLMVKVFDQGVHVVISDMAPNMSGNKTVDQAKTMYLVELALDFAKTVLKPNGNFVCKIFQGEGFDSFLRECKQLFSSVKTRKPSASRSRSPEVYVVAKGYIPKSV